MPVASGPRLDTPQQPWRYPVNSVQEFFEPLPPRRPPPGPLAWLRSLAPAPTRSATPVTRLFDGHAAARMVLLTGLRGSGHHLLLRARLAQDLSERTGHQTLPITTVARGLSLREVRCGPYLPVEERCQERQQQQQQQQPWWGLTAWFTPSAGQKKRRQHCFRQLDIGCPPKTHALVRRMFSFADAVVWVMDATDRDTPRQSLDRLAHIILDSTGLPPDKPLLILLNWNGMERNEKAGICKILDNDKQIVEMIGTRAWTVMDIDVITGDGVLEAFRWLSDAIENKLPAHTEYCEGQYTTPATKY